VLGFGKPATIGSEGKHQERKQGGLMDSKERVTLKLRRIACGASMLAGKELHYLNDDLEPWLPTNEDIKEYHKLLDILTLLR
jgi:hypothetical protein